MLEKRREKRRTTPCDSADSQKECHCVRDMRADALDAVAVEEQMQISLANVGGNFRCRSYSCLDFSAALLDWLLLIELCGSC